MPSKAATAAPGVDKTLTKGLQLLEALAESEQSRGISELALQLSLTKSNVHRLLQTLVKCGYVGREANTERYLLSTKLWRISRRGRPFDSMRQLIRPVLRGVVDETGESALFCIRDNDELTPVDQVESPGPVRIFFSVGQPFPVDRVIMSGKDLTAIQLIALAGRPQLEVQAAARRIQKDAGAGPAYGEALVTRIEQIRRDGFAFSRGEWVSGVSAVAVPVMDRAQETLGVLSCFGPSDRLPDTQLKRVQKILLRAAAEIGRRVGA